MTRTSLITGASAGLGAEYARALARRGDHLVLVARRASALEELATELESLGADGIEVLSADLAQDADVQAVVARLSEPSRPVDVLVSSAGFGLPLAFERNDIEDEVRHLRLHDEVPMRLMHAVLPGMLERGRGAILNIASVAAFTPRSTYSAAKAWTVSFSRWANARYRPRGVSVTAVCPGFTHTEFHARMGLARGKEGIPGWMWLDAPRVVEESLHDVARGRAISVPSRRYRAIVALTRFLPTGLLAKAAARGR
ncbi:SDR family oxidoreductase [Brachybacterium sp. ACRRE]|uniref:SDR family NAD(P)-dependent oxidoreductase n=1 Tax=Brachybacterium sp. ACRRE TaxID=2918184 RepID=UPI001EF21E2F|nr:SDR family NAD(P)-dependent oxidoreductase [Brachybacterium sp. ACRRE]MCG7308191.1 SDR family NAD(P)-dependent oxidoreductase [Brachybacterium sp. ACRRE]